MVFSSRPVFIGLDHLDGLVGPIVGEIAAGFEPITAIEAGRKTPHPTKEPVNGVIIQLGLDNIRVILRKTEHIVHGFLVDDGIPQAIFILSGNPVDHFAHAVRQGHEFIPEPGGVAPRHDGGPERSAGG